MSNPGGSGPEHLRVMTYNIHRWTSIDGKLNLDRLTHVIESSGADVVGLNEVLHPVTMGGRRKETLADLAGRLGMNYAFGPNGWEDFGPSWRGPAGNALLSRYPLADIQNTTLPKFPGSKQRSLLSARVASGPAEGLTALVIHLDHAFEWARVYQVQAALQHAPADGPHFIAGDFNAPAFHGPRMKHLTPPVLRLLTRAGYRDAFRAVGEGNGRTFPAHSPLFRIDYLFVPKRWVRGLRSARAVDGKVALRASDHRPVMVEWAWPQPSAS